MSDYRAIARRTFWSERDRSTYECPDCGRTEDEIRHEFEVHHIDGDKTNNEFTNLVALCRHCHNIREGKKPSLRDSRFLRDQFTSRSTPSSESVNPPICRSSEAVDEVVDACDERNEPALVIRQAPAALGDEPIGLPKYEVENYYIVQSDFMTTSRFYEQDKRPANSDVMKHATLTDDAQDVVEKLFQRYHEQAAESGDHEFWPVTFATGTSPRFEALRLPAAKRLAKELQFIIKDTSNWTHDPREHEYRPKTSGSVDLA